MPHCSAQSRQDRARHQETSEKGEVTEQKLYMGKTHMCAVFFLSGRLIYLEEACL